MIKIAAKIIWRILLLKRRILLLKWRILMSERILLSKSNCVKHVIKKLWKQKYSWKSIKICMIVLNCHYCFYILIHTKQSQKYKWKDPCPLYLTCQTKPCGSWCSCRGWGGKVKACPTRSWSCRATSQSKTCKQNTGYK